MAIHRPSISQRLRARLRPQRFQRVFLGSLLLRGLELTSRTLR